MTTVSCLEEQFKTNKYNHRLCHHVELYKRSPPMGTALAFVAKTAYQNHQCDPHMHTALLYLGGLGFFFFFLSLQVVPEERGRSVKQSRCLLVIP